jgi:hypothetical protein
METDTRDATVSRRTSAQADQIIRFTRRGNAARLVAYALGTLALLLVLGYLGASGYIADQARHTASARLRWFTQSILSAGTRRRRGTADTRIQVENAYRLMAAANNAPGVELCRCRAPTTSRPSPPTGRVYTARMLAFFEHAL